MPKETDRLKLPLPLGNENVTRESINRIFEKIDAGVATRESILIPAESDLNSYITEGEYYCPTNATVETLLNSPTGEAFHLTVEPHAGVLQTLTTFQPGNLEVFQRNYYFGWGAWKKVPTRDELEEMLNKADENAEGYATAAVKPIIEGYSPNLVKNSTANLGLTNWNHPEGTSYWVATTSVDTRLAKYFSMYFPLTSGLNAALDSDPITVSAGDYMLQAVFYTWGMNEGNLYIEVINAASNATITSLAANGNMGWHRKTKIVTIATGVTAIKLRLVVSGPVTNTTKAISRIKFSRDSTDVPYSAEGDDLALFEKGQMFKLTNDSGRVKSTLSTINFNDLIAAGQYFVNPGVPNAPVGGGATGGFFVEVIVYSELYVLQRATKQTLSPTTFMRIRLGGVWTDWVAQTPERKWGPLSEISTPIRLYADSVPSTNTVIYSGVTNKVTILKSLIVCGSGAESRFRLDINGTLFCYHLLKPNETIVIPVMDMIIAPGVNISMYCPTGFCSARLTAAQIDAPSTSAAGIEFFTDSLGLSGNTKEIVTSGKKRIIKSIVLCNTSNLPSVVGLRIGGNADNYNMVRDYTMKGYETIHIPVTDSYMDVSDRINGWCNTSNTVYIMVSTKVVT